MSQTTESATVFTTPSDREIVFTRVFDAPPELVWRASTDPAGPPQWMLGHGDWTMSACEIDLRQGGTWRFVWDHSGGGRMEVSGVYKEVEAPTRLVSTEAWGGDWPETLSTLQLTTENGRTTVAKQVLYPTKEARDAALNTAMRDGVSANHDRLAEYLRTTATA